MDTAPLVRPGRLGLTAICLGFLMVTLDATIVNVALNPIVSDLDGDVASAQWIVDGYTIAFAALLLTAGALADRVGARAGFLIGLAVFGAASAACSAAPSFGVLIAARVAQEAGAAWLMPCSLALITHTFPEGAERRRALAVWGAASGVGLAAGPVAGGLLAAGLGWRSIFLVNVPVAVVAAVLLIRHLPETRRHRHPLDATGQILAAIGLLLITSGCILAGRNWTTVALLGGGGLTIGVFLAVERRATHPMLNPKMFGRRPFSLSVAIGATFNFTLYGALFCLSLGLRSIDGLGALATGMALLPMTFICGFAPPSAPGGASPGGAGGRSWSPA